MTMGVRTVPQALPEDEEHGAEDADARGDAVGVEAGAEAVVVQEARCLAREQETMTRTRTMKTGTRTRMKGRQLMMWMAKRVQQQRWQRQSPMRMRMTSFPCLWNRAFSSMAATTCSRTKSCASTLTRKAKRRLTRRGICLEVSSRKTLSRLYGSQLSEIAADVGEARPGIQDGDV